MTTAHIPLAPKMVPVFTGEARYRGAFGGRGSTKTRAFALMSAVKAYQFAEAGQEGQILCGREFQNSLDESSMVEVKAAIRAEQWLDDYFDIGEQYIRTKNRRVNYTFAGLRYNVDSLKSRSRILLAWIDEGERVREASWRKLIPTVREAGSEIWVTWNPEDEMSATNQRFRVNPPKRSRIVEINWSDNPWFPEVLNQERLEDKRLRPDTYDHVWEGGFLNIMEGAFFSREMRAAETENRITTIPIEQHIRTFTFWDLGVSDDMAIWVMQPVGKELRLVACYSNNGYGIEHYINWLQDFAQEHRIRWAETAHYAPHDIEVRELTSGQSRKAAAARMGIQFETVPRVQNKQESIDALRRLFSRIWFDRNRCAAGGIIGAMAIPKGLPR